MSVVEVTVKSVKGKCNFGHKVGDKIVFNGRTVEDPICISALSTLMPDVYAYCSEQSSRGKKRKTLATAPVPTLKTPLSLRFDA